MGAQRIETIVAAKLWPELQKRKDRYLPAGVPLTPVPKELSETRSRARSLPSLLRTSGLVVTLSMLLSRDEKARDGDHWIASTLYDTVRHFFPGLPEKPVEFVSSLPSHQQAEIEAVSRIVADILKRSAEVLIPKPED